MQDAVPAPQLVTTIRERCRACYTCVRECPAKAIQILDGQASVIQARCIGCGNCVTVCSQQAKLVASGIEATETLLSGHAPVAAIIAPSYPAEFSECTTSGLVAALRALGFTYVHEVGFGADLVAARYARLLEEQDSARFVATTCPAVVSYVRKYHPDLHDHLAPIVSPMLATARVLHRKYGPGTRVVFIGPCIAKKGEADDGRLHREVDVVLTYVEARTILERRGVDLATPAEADDFDAPRSGLGALFPITGGMLQAAGLEEDLLTGDVVSADGRTNLADAIVEFEHGETEARLLDILCCQGCIMGAGFSRDEHVFKRRSDVSRETRARHEALDKAAWRAAMTEYESLDLSCSFAPSDQRIDGMPTDDELVAVLARMNKSDPGDELDCGACGYETCRDHAVAIWQGVAEVEMCLPYTVDELRRTVHELQESHRSLDSTREALVKSEKLASMGQLAAGIAHEVNNPLGILLLHANLLLEECAGDDPAVEGDLRLIVDQANRCKKIISGLLNFARQTRVVRQPVDLRVVVREVLQTVLVDEGVVLRLDDRLVDPTVELDADQMVQVLANLLSNAQHALGEGGTVVVTLEGTQEDVSIGVSDDGCGIATEHLDKLFSPFFTTKQVGKGTGLGLAVTHGIVKMHGGHIDVASNADPRRGPTGTTFTIILPRRETPVTGPAPLADTGVRTAF